MERAKQEHFINPFSSHFFCIFLFFLNQMPIPKKGAKGSPRRRRVYKIINYNKKVVFKKFSNFKEKNK